MPVEDLAFLAKLANEEFVREHGVRFFEMPARQLFTHSPNGDLVVNPEAEHNRKLLAKLALDFQGCNAATSGVSLRRSLAMSADGASLLYATGAKLLCAVGVRNGTPRMLAMAYVTALKPNVLEPVVLNAMQALPTKALYLELVCAEPKTGGATYLLLRLLAKLVRTNTGILAHTVNAKSRALMERHAYVRPTRRNDVYYLSRENAVAHLQDYEGMLRTATPTLALCTRAGLSPRTSGRTFWDCR